MRGRVFAYRGSQRNDIPIYSQRIHGDWRHKSYLHGWDDAGGAEDYLEMGFALYLQRAVRDVLRRNCDGDRLTRCFWPGEYGGAYLGGAVVRECNLLRSGGQPLQRNFLDQQFRSHWHSA